MKRQTDTEREGSGIRGTVCNVESNPFWQFELATEN